MTQRRELMKGSIDSLLLTLTVVTYYTDGRLGLPAFSALILLMISIFLLPALLEHKVTPAYAGA